MNYYKLIKLSIIFLAFALLSCRKKYDCPVPSVTPAPSKTSLLINRNWQKILHTKVVGSNAPENIYFNTPKCERDDIIVFSATSTDATGGTSLLKVNVKCNTETDSTTPWIFNADQTEIISEGESLKILELTNSIFKISFSTMNGAVTATETITYGKVD